MLNGVARKGRAVGHVQAAAPGFGQWGTSRAYDDNIIRHNNSPSFEAPVDR